MKPILAMGCKAALLLLLVGLPPGPPARAEERAVYSEPLPELKPEEAGRALSPERVVMRETYGEGSPALFTATEAPAFRATMEVSGHELKIADEAGAMNFAVVMLSPHVVYPLTLDLKMRMEIAPDGWVIFNALNAGRLAAPGFRHDRLHDKAAKGNLRLDPAQQRTYRFVFDAEGRGRIYLLGEGGQSIPVGSIDAPKVPQERASLDFRVKNATVWIEEAALYIGTP